MALLSRARVVDRFEGGTGKLIARLLGLIPVARSQGPATDRGEVIRGLAELPWRPFAFRESRLLSWQTAERPFPLLRKEGLRGRPGAVKGASLLDAAKLPLTARIALQNGLAGKGRLARGSGIYVNDVAGLKCQPCSRSGPIQ